MNPVEKTDRTQMIKVGLLVVVMLIVIWQVYGLFSASSSEPVVPAAKNKSASAQANFPPMKQTSLIAKQEQPLTEREKQLIKLQQETNAKYLVALSDLQMLKLNLQIAELNRSIMRARLDTANDEKRLVELIEGPTSQFARNIVPPAQIQSAKTQQSQAEAQPEQPSPPQLPQFTVISVSQLQGKWSAVIGLQGKVQTVVMGDELPNQQGKVVKIDKAGVVVESGKETTRVNILSTI